MSAGDQPGRGNFLIDAGRAGGSGFYLFVYYNNIFISGRFRVFLGASQVRRDDGLMKRAGGFVSASSTGRHHHREDLLRLGYIRIDERPSMPPPTPSFRHDPLELDSLDSRPKV